MAEYILRDQAIMAVTGAKLPDVSASGLPIANGKRSVTDCVRRLKEIPAADVRPVARARWQYKTMTVPGGKGQTYAKWCCTACKGKAKERTNFCPNCGAMMEES